MAPFIKKQGRHSWVEEALCVADAAGHIGRNGIKLDPSVPPLPTCGIPTTGQKLYRCTKCSWWRVTAKSARGNDNDFYYYRPGQSYRSWSSFFVQHRPKCGEAKR